MLSENGFDENGAEEANFEILTVLLAVKKGYLTAESLARNFLAGKETGHLLVNIAYSLQALSEDDSLGDRG